MGEEFYGGKFSSSSARPGNWKKKRNLSVVAILKNHHLFRRGEKNLLAGPFDPTPAQGAGKKKKHGPVLFGRRFSSSMTGASRGERERGKYCVSTQTGE